MNIARLRIRAGNGRDAWSLLERLHQAITARTDTVIDGIEIPAARLTGAADVHRELRAWLWTVLLADGARALAATGRWHDAYHQLSRYRGIGHRMLDGRQVAVLAHATSGDRNTALALLNDTQPGEPWEAAVTTCLTLLCQHHTASRIESWAAYREVENVSTSGLAVFRTRLGLTLIDAHGGIRQPASRAVAARIVDHAATDGYAAREVLAHPGCRGMATDQQLDTLTGLVESCGLDTGVIPDRFLASISVALDIADSVISLPSPLPRHPLGDRPP